jgi:hypothetical protein
MTDMTQIEIDNEFDLDRLRRKENEAWELAGCARVDRDKTDEARWTAIARAIRQRMLELRGSQ